MPLALHALFSNQRPTGVLRLNNCVSVGKDITAPVEIAPSADMASGARAVLIGCLAHKVPAQHPRFRAASSRADAIQAGSQYGPPAAKQREIAPTGVICAHLDFTKQIMATMHAFYLALSMLGQCQGPSRRKIAFVMSEHTTSRKLKRATAAVPIEV